MTKFLAFFILVRKLMLSQGTNRIWRMLIETEQRAPPSFWPQTGLHRFTNDRDQGAPFSFTIAVMGTLLRPVHGGRPACKIMQFGSHIAAGRQNPLGLQNGYTSRGVTL